MYRILMVGEPILVRCGPMIYRKEMVYVGRNGRRVLVRPRRGKILQPYPEEAEFWVLEGGLWKNGKEIWRKIDFI